MLLAPLLLHPLLRRGGACVCGGDPLTQRATLSPEKGETQEGRKVGRKLEVRFWETYKLQQMWPNDFQILRLITKIPPQVHLAGFFSMQTSLQQKSLRSPICPSSPTPRHTPSHHLFIVLILSLSRACFQACGHLPTSLQARKLPEGSSLPASLIAFPRGLERHLAQSHNLHAGNCFRRFTYIISSCPNL